MKFVVGNPAEARQLVEWVGNKLMSGEKVSVAEFCNRAGILSTPSDRLRGWTPDQSITATVSVNRVGKVFKHTEVVIDISDPVAHWVDLSDLGSISGASIEPIKDDTEDQMVSHPPHYQSETGLEVIDVIEAFTFDLGGIEATDTGNILKYMCRWKHKNGLQDLKKAKWYLDHLINHVETLEKENN